MAFVFLGMVVPDVISRPVLQVVAVYALNTVQILERETSDERALHFSRFASPEDRTQVNSRTAWLITIVPMLAIDVAVLLYNLSVSPRLAILAALAAAHYLRRIWEILYVHIYSTHMTHGAIATLLINNAAILISTVYCTRWVPPALYSGPESRFVLAVGVAIFLAGETVAMHHHLLLARLRGRPEDARKYAVPTGGLFDLVVCPHYLAHVVSWLGIAVTSQSWLGIMCQLVINLAFFVPRSKRTLDWYAAKFGDWPKGRRQLVPYFK